VVLTKKGRNVSPEKTKLLVTNLRELAGRQVIDIYQRRWAVEILFKELKSGLGFGEHQVTKRLPRIEKSLGIALIAYLLLLRARKDDIKPGNPWSIFQLKTNFTLDMIYNQFQHSIRLEVRKSLKAA
jgi:IS4 transposase